MISLRFFKNWLGQLTDEQLDLEAAIEVEGKKIVIDKLDIDFDTGVPILKGKES